MRHSWLALTLVAAACAPASQPAPAGLPQFSADVAEVFPADRGLVRPEDGVALPDGRLIVADQVNGLRFVSPEGESFPFGSMTSVGYVHQPPDLAGAANGVSLAPDGRTVLVADVFGGGIYRVDVETGAASKLYQHTDGVNAAVEDPAGAIWFTQSTRTDRANAEATLFRSVDVPVSDGALFRIGPSAAGQPAERVLDGLMLANGVAIDGNARRLYVAETTANRVLVFQLDLETGRLSDRQILAEITSPDNLELDEYGQLWVASPLRNEIIVIDPVTRLAQSVFRAASPDNDRVTAEWARRGAAGEPRLDLLAPASWAPLPALVTGIILTPGGGPVYLTGLGDALVRLSR